MIQNYILKVRNNILRMIHERQYWAKKAKEIIIGATTKHGIKASLTDDDNYGAIFTRDAVMAGICGLLTKDPRIIQGLIETVKNLKKLQRKQGQIASNYKIQNGEVTHVSYGTLSPKIDSCTWYLIAIGILIRDGKIDKNEYIESVEKTIELLEAIEFNGKELMYIPKGGNWADEYIYEGYILYDQLLRIWALALLGEAYSNIEWYEKAKAIKERITQSFQTEECPYYISGFNPGGKFNRFDLAALSIATLIFDKNDLILKSTFEWIEKTFLDEGKLPTAFHPVIDENDELWNEISNFYMFRFKNKPHHFHNGGIWWIWLGWLALGMKWWDKSDSLIKLKKRAFDYLNSRGDSFLFNEYISGDTYELNGTKCLVYSAIGVIFLSDTDSFNLNKIVPFVSSLIDEPLILKTHYQHLSESIYKELVNSGQLEKDKLIIAIGGESGSGKSTTAKALQDHLSKKGIPSFILHQDSYYLHPPKINSVKRKVDKGWVGKNEVKLHLLDSHLEKFNNKESVLEIPVLEYENNKFTDQNVIVKDYEVLIVEGTYAFYLNNSDYKIHMNRTYKDTLEIRKSRTRENYDPYVESILQIEHEIVLEKAKDAHAVVTNNYLFEVQDS